MPLPSAAVLLGLLAALGFGASSITAKRGLAYVNPHTGTLISLSTTVALYLLCAPWWMHGRDWFTPGFWIFVINGLMHPMLSMYFAFEATSRTGATVAATLSSTTPLFATATAIVFLGESPSTAVVIGTLATVGGIAVLSWSPAGISRLMLAALLFATGAAIIRGLNHTVGKFGLELLPNVFMASFVSFFTALCGTLILYRVRFGDFPTRVGGRGLAYFVITGALIAAAILCMYGALARGEVVAVSPLIASYPLFTFLIAVSLGQDVLTRRLLAGVIAVVGGVIIISVASAAY
ncbi:MAG: DMT family transporter [Gammaproteobacteria bacterium]|nr:DMT family transporter [Gammaproteobacteria bacterium]MDH3465120.1 DMT family transporter [Gammaproteobacteria bacterium]